MIALCPCAGTGDACPYTGFVKAMKEFYTGEVLMTRVMAVILKIGGIFRVGKRTTGCNMEGIGAGAAVSAAAFEELAGGTPAQMKRACWRSPRRSACPAPRGCSCRGSVPPTSAAS